MKSKVKKIALLITFSLSYSFYAYAQNFENFKKYFKNYKLPEKAKTNCNWIFAIVAVNTDVNNTIIKVKCLNDVDSEFKKSFNFLIGYTFDKNIKINRRPIIFYFSILNSEVCIVKPTDQVYEPNSVAGTIYYYMLINKLLYPNAIFVPDPILKDYYPPQR